MNTKCVTGQCVMRFGCGPLVIALLVSQSLACTVDAQPEATAKESEPPEAAAEQSEAPGVIASASGQRAPVFVLPDQAVQFPRTVALQRPDHITVVSHQGIAAVSNRFTGSPR